MQRLQDIVRNLVTGLCVLNKLQLVTLMNGRLVI